jgi:hypothetical protein
MASHTERFGFTTLDNALDSLAAGGYKFTDADQILLDRLLTHVVEHHRHDGAVVTVTRDPGPGVMVRRTGGMLPTDRDVYYRTALVDNLGQEHVASQVTTVHTFPALAAPQPPMLAPTSGTLMAGEYLYTVSAWTQTDNQETTVSRAANGALAAFGGFLVTMPLPAVTNESSTGWNVYRKGPTDFEPVFVKAIPRSTAVFIDDGSTVVGKLRPQPTRNTTSSTTSMEITRPEPLPPNWTIKVYRSLNATDWADSLWEWSAILPVTDTGHATQHGTPLNSAAAVNGAPKIDLAADTQGSLPPGRIRTSHNVTFNFDGQVRVGVGAWQWLNEYAETTLVSMRATLGRDGTPATQSVLVGLEVSRDGETTWTRYTDPYLVQDVQVEIPVGAQFSAPVAFTTYQAPWITLGPGDSLRPAIIQRGGGAAPTDQDLSLNIKIDVVDGPVDQSYVWATD